MFKKHERLGLPSPSNARRLRRQAAQQAPQPFAGGLKPMVAAVRNALWARYVARIV